MKRNIKKRHLNWKWVICQILQFGMYDILNRGGKKGSQPKYIYYE